MMLRFKYNSFQIRSCALIAVVCLLQGIAYATKLDLSSEVEMKAVNYTRLLYNGQRTSQDIYSENAAIGFIIKDIKLEQTPNSIMDVGIVLNSVGIGPSSTTVTAPQFSEAMSRYPDITGMPFVKEAYVKVYKFFGPRTTATLGRQAFTLGQGIALTDDGLGLPGARIEAENIFRTIKGEVFFFRPYLGGDFARIYGASIYYPANEGLWHAYYFRENSNHKAKEVGFDSKSRAKTFAGLRYFLNYTRLNFDGEFIMQRGSAREQQTGGTVKYNGYAFILKGAWEQDISFLKASKVRMAYGKSSGNSGTVGKTDKAFFPSFGHRYKGIERDGYGELAGASLYDIIPTSATTNGLPDGVSGINTINIGFDLPYKKMVFSADIYKFRAAQNISKGSLQIGSELDLKAALVLGKGLRLKAVYAIFSPLGLYRQATPMKLLSMSLTAKF